jgi:hypothetical protein
VDGTDLASHLISGATIAAAAEAVLQAIAELLPPEKGASATIPGWQYRDELMPED